MGGQPTRIFLLILPSTTCARSAGVRGRVEKRGALGCGDTDEFRQAFKTAMIDRQRVFSAQPIKPRYKERLT